MRLLPDLFQRNREWAEERKRLDPEFFSRLSHQQAPKYLWIGCSDSRVPANQIVGMDPGELFVHRNVANIVVHTDFNCLSVIQYAVEALGVEHIIVCGHYECGGVRAAFENRRLGLIDNWLRNIKDIYRYYHDEIEALPDEQAQLRRLYELNVVHQVSNVCHTTIVQNAWQNGRPLAVHGWIYSVEDGLLRDLRVCRTAADEIAAIYRMEA
jgi:carbonic anhydrase